MSHLDKTLTDLNRRALNLREYAVDDVIPEYIQQEYPKFVNFIKHYYDFENEEDSPSRLIDELFVTRDITQTDLQLLTYIEDELLLGQSYFEGFRDKRAAAKYSSTLYRSKGTKYSIEQFFRTFFNLDPDVIYTKEQVFKVGSSQIGPDSLKFLTDDKLYQEFAILIKNEISVNEWRSSYKLFVHPAGMYLGGEIQIVSLVDLDIDFQPGPGEAGVEDFEVESVAFADPYATNQMTALFQYQGTNLDEGNLFRTMVGNTIGRDNDFEGIADRTVEEIDGIYSSLAEYVSPDSPTFDEEDSTTTDYEGNVLPRSGVDMSAIGETMDLDRFTWEDGTDIYDSLDELPDK